MAEDSYFIFDFVGSFVIRRVGAANLLSFMVICWGGVTIGSGFVNSWQILAVCRALLGAFEVRFKHCVFLPLGWPVFRLRVSHLLLVQKI